MSSRREVLVGVDVGETHTDAVVMQNGEILGKFKNQTTDDITSGVISAVDGALLDSAGADWVNALSVQRVHIGTTHFVNAVVQKSHLAKVAVLRMCGPATDQLPPFIDFPKDLKEVIAGPVLFLDGGWRFKCEKEIAPVSRKQVEDAVDKIRAAGVLDIVVSGVFSSVNNSHEIQVGEWLSERYPEASVTLSHNVAGAGLLPRENSAILNQSLKPLARRVIRGFAEAFKAKKLSCPIFYTQNDGTLLNAAQVIEMPVLTIQTGSVNSMRGAAYLSGEQDAVVADIGWTRTNVGVLVEGIPRPAPSKVQVGGVHTNLMMPDTLSMAVGAESIVAIYNNNNEVKVGPTSVGNGNCLHTEAHQTLTDIVLASGHTKIEKHANGVNNTAPETVEKALKCFYRKLEDLVNAVKASAEEIPLILVGGGSDLISPSWSMRGVSKVIRPRHSDVANAVGAALSQVSDEPTSLPVKLHITDAPTHKTTVSETDNIDGFETPPTFSVVNTASENEFCTQENEFEEELMPDVDPKTGEWTLSVGDVEAISVGAGILGCGGGGNPYFGKLRLQHAIEQGKRVRVIHPKRFVREAPEGACALPVSYMGAPTVISELMYASVEMKSGFRAMQQLYACGGYQDGKLRNTDGVEVIENVCHSYINDYKPPEGPQEYPELNIAALLTVEIGGCNSMEPLILGAELDLPTLDCDTMGRALPQLQMCSTFMQGVRPQPTVLSNCTGRTAVCLHAKDAKVLEDHFRVTCVDMGCLTPFLGPPLTKDDVTGKTVQYSTSRAWRLGRAVLSARANKVSPVETILKHEGGKSLFTGKVVDVERKTIGGFARGVLEIESDGNGDDTEHRRYTLLFQNEYLIAKVQHGDYEKVLATVPDLIAMVEAETGEPIASDEVRYGLHVAVLGLPAPPMLTSPLALTYVGPHAFGYTGDEGVYKPLGDFVEHDPVPLP